MEPQTLLAASLILAGWPDTTEFVNGYCDGYTGADFGVKATSNPPNRYYREGYTDGQTDKGIINAEFPKNA